jgi:hypothetical protein
LVSRLLPMKPAKWSAMCECGSVKIVHASNLCAGRHQSCGCKRNENNTMRATHGATTGGIRTPEYQVWRNMRQRCYNPSNPGWKNYGARGITVCPRWDAYEAFIADMGPRPSPKHSLDRIDNDKEYTSSNCRWATRTMQNRNRRSSVLNPDLVSSIREMNRNGRRPRQIGRALNLNEATVSNVVSGKSWVGV